MRMTKHRAKQSAGDWRRRITKLVKAVSTALRIAARGSFGGGGHRRGFLAVHKVFQFLAGLKERNFLCGDVHFLTGLGIATGAAAALTRAEAAKSANLNLVALLQRFHNPVQ